MASFSLCFVKADSRTVLQDDPEETFQRIVDIFIAAWPMSVPTVLIVALAVRVIKLNAQGIDTLQPAKLIAAADIEAVCFDKTGTLTANTVRTAPVLHAYHHCSSTQGGALWPSSALLLMCILLLGLHAKSCQSCCLTAASNTPCSACSS